MGNQTTATDEFAEVVRYYDLWRRITSYVGEKPGDEADWEDGRLYFRFDYLDKVKDWPKWKELGDWAAYVIEPTAEGLYNVIRSLRHEGAPKRSEDVEAVFARIPDVGKYIVAHIGNYLRIDLGMDSLVRTWEATGLDPRIQKAQANKRAIDYLLTVSPDTPKEFAEKYLRQFTLIDDPSSYGFALPAEEIYMQVLALSYDELNASLIRDMPNSADSKLAGWAGQLGIRGFPI